MARRGWVAGRRVRVIVPGSVLAMLVALTACSGGHATDPHGGTTPAAHVTLARCAKAGAVAAAPGGLPDLTLACLGRGPVVGLSGIAGPAVVNLWASWCYPCRQEMPLLEHESKAQGGRVAIIGVDTNDEAGHAIAFAQNTVGAGYEELSDPTGRLATSLRAPGLPFTVAIERSGRVVWRHAGQLTGGQISQAVHSALTGG